MSEGAKKEDYSAEKAKFEHHQDTYHALSYQRDHYSMNPMHWFFLLTMITLTFGALLVLILSYMPGIKKYIFEAMDFVLQI